MKATYCFKEKILAKNDTHFLCFYKGCLYLKDNEYRNVKRIRIHNYFFSIRIIERLLRKEPRIAIPLNDHLFLYSDNGKAYVIDINSFTIECIHEYSRGMNNPLSFCARYDNSGNVCEVLYGEYIWNDEKGPVSIYKYDLKKVEIVYTFPSNTIQHIHNIVYDDFHNRYIVLTGDSDDESAIWEATTDFSDVKKIIGGNQKFRSCICMPTEKGIYYLTDTPLSTNHLFYLNNSNELLEISQISGPCIYGVFKDNALLFATSVEGDPTKSKLRYRLSYKLGRGVKDRFVHIMYYDNNKGLIEITRFKKDILPMWLFQFGNASFVFDNNNVFFTTQSTYNAGTYKIRIEDK